MEDNTFKDFQHMMENAHRFTQDNLEYCLTQQGAIDFICCDCDFFKEDDRYLECTAMKIVKLLLSKRIISPEDIVHAVQD